VQRATVSAAVWGVGVGRTNLMYHDPDWGDQVTKN